MTDCRAQGLQSAPDVAVEASQARSAFFPGSETAQIEPVAIQLHDNGAIVWPASPASDKLVQRSKEALRLRLYIGLLLIDALCVFGGFVTAIAIRFDDPLAVRGLSYSAAILPLFLALSLASGA